MAKLSSPPFINLARSSSRNSINYSSSHKEGKLYISVTSALVHGRFLITSSITVVVTAETMKTLRSLCSRSLVPELLETRFKTGLKSGSTVTNVKTFRVKLTVSAAGLSKEQTAFLLKLTKMSSQCRSKTSYSMSPFGYFNSIGGHHNTSGAN